MTLRYEFERTYQKMVAAYLKVLFCLFKEKSRTLSVMMVGFQAYNEELSRYLDLKNRNNAHPSFYNDTRLQCCRAARGLSVLCYGRYQPEEQQRMGRFFSCEYMKHVLMLHETQISRQYQAHMRVPDCR
jgi:hypothetical protein